jgi:hypothetical protein
LNLTNQILDQYYGIRVIPDIHGEAELFSECIEAAIRENLFIIQLGDLIDFGPDSLGCLEIALDLISSQRGLVLKSNHEDKLYRYCLGNSVDILKSPFCDTLELIINKPNSIKILNKFEQQYINWPYWINWKNFVFVHAAFSTQMLELTAPLHASISSLKRKLISLALFGETNAEFDENGFPIRTYKWVDEIPEGKNIIVGHDIHSLTNPVQKVNNQKGKVIFLDTGCGKGGKLSYKDILFQ